MRFLVISMLTMLPVCYVYHKSILSYIVQQYHYASDMLVIQNPFFTLGDTISQSIENLRLTLFESDIQALESPLPQEIESPITPTIELTRPLDTQNIIQKDIIQETMHKDSTQDNSMQLHPNTPQHNSILMLQPQTRFLLIGDSLMQGIGMVLPRMLQQQGFRVKNIAKQSTGLTYPAFFDWHKATKQAFIQYPDIGVVVVCLGANDPWNMPKMRFGTTEWEETYKERIQAILDIAKTHNAIVVWYAVPITKNANLNKKLLYLNSLYEQVVNTNGGLFLSSDAILYNGQFSAYLKDSTGKSKLVRAPDGIHFSTYGAKLLAQTLMEHIALQAQTLDSDINNTKQTPTTQQDTTNNNPKPNLTPIEPNDDTSHFFNPHPTHSATQSYEKKIALPYTIDSNNLHNKHYKQQILPSSKESM